jgi:hypothetical protein
MFFNLCHSYFTADTYTNEHSALAARLAAGLCAYLATEVMTGQAQNGFALVCNSLDVYFFDISRETIF